MNADWFDMKDIRKRRLADAVWIPLRVSETLSEEGEYGYPGYRREFFGLGSVAIPVDKHADAEDLGWGNIGIIHEQGVWADNDIYKPAEIYQYNTGQNSGLNSHSCRASTVPSRGSGS